MNKIIKFVLLFVLTITLGLMLPNYSKAATSVHDEESLNNEISSADSGATITLENDITVTKPIVIEKELIIDGNGHNVVGSNDWTSTSGNQTMFTAQLSAGKLTLKNINLKNGPKYGAQSYDGATLILDNVSITGFKYGAVLANGGKVEVKKLHLGTNGTGENNGIEIDKGAAATNNPTLVMNGILTSDSNKNVIRPAENGNLKEFTITNTETTTNKVVLAGNKVVLTDASNNVISETEVPNSVTTNADTKKIIISIVASDITNKFTIDSGEKITADLLKTHIKLGENQVIDGFFAEANFVTEFNFDNPVTEDKTIYAKISTVENNVPEPVPEVTTPAKDETPKTGVENYLGIAILTMVASAALISYMNKKEIKG